MEKLLLVEDDPILTRMFTRSLSEENFYILTASGQPAATAVMGSEKPDLTPVDISLSKRNFRDLTGS